MEGLWRVDRVSLSGKCATHLLITPKYLFSLGFSFSSELQCPPSLRPCPATCASAAFSSWDASSAAQGLLRERSKDLSRGLISSFSRSRFAGLLDCRPCRSRLKVLFCQNWIAALAAFSMRIGQSELPQQHLAMPHAYEEDLAMPVFATLDAF